MNTGIVSLLWLFSSLSTPTSGCVVGESIESFPQVMVSPLQSKMETNRSGCCSHHGGVCGCQDGRNLCCDGSLSPSCGC